MEQAKEDADEPLDMRWPDTTRKRITYVILTPIMIPLWLTLPDVRNPVSHTGNCGFSSIR